MSWALFTWGGVEGYQSNNSKPSLLSLSIESTDFALRDTPVMLTGGFSEVRLDASNDDVTLEFGDTTILRPKCSQHS